MNNKIFDSTQQTKDLDLYKINQTVFGLRARSIPISTQTGISKPVNIAASTSNIIPSIDNNYSLGNINNAWDSIYSYNYYFPGGLAKLSYADVIVGFDSSCDFQATGANDQATILAAINYAISNNRRRIRLRSGTYHFGATLTVPKDASIMIYGDRWETGSNPYYGGVHIIADVSMTNLIEFKGNSVPTAYSDLSKGLRLEDIELDGAGKVTNVLYLLNTDRIEANWCRFISGLNGIYADYDGADPIGSTSYQPGGIRISNCNFNVTGNSGSNAAIYLKYQTQCWFTSNWFAQSSAGDYFIIIDRSDKMHFVNNEFNGTNIACIYITDSATTASANSEFTGGTMIAGNGKTQIITNCANASSVDNVVSGVAFISTATLLTNSGTTTNVVKLLGCGGPGTKNTLSPTMTISDTGALFSQMITDSTQAFRWLNVAGNVALNVDSTNRIVTTLKFQAGDGAANSPTYSFSNSTAMGLFRAANNVIGFTTASTEAMRIDASQRVGIGGTPTAEKLEVTGNIAMVVAGDGLKIKEGSNARMGVATLGAGGTIVVNNTSITANTRIFLTTQTAGGTVGSPYVSATSVGTSFTISSTNAADTSTVAYLLIEAL